MSLADAGFCFFVNTMVYAGEAMEHFINPQPDVNKNIPLKH